MVLCNMFFFSMQMQTKPIPSKLNTQSKSNHITANVFARGCQLVVIKLQFVCILRTIRQVRSFVRSFGRDVAIDRLYDADQLQSAIETRSSRSSNGNGCLIRACATDCLITGDNAHKHSWFSQIESAVCRLLQRRHVLNGFSIKIKCNFFVSWL